MTMLTVLLLLSRKEWKHAPVMFSLPKSEDITALIQEEDEFVQAVRNTRKKKLRKELSKSYPDTTVPR